MIGVGLCMAKIWVFLLECFSKVIIGNLVNHKKFESPRYACKSYECDEIQGQ
jgi:hypothetical protein